MVKRIVNWEYYVLAGVLAAVLLLAGIYFGLLVSREKVDAMQAELERTKMEQEDFVLKSTIMSLGSNSCDALSYEFERAVDDASKLGQTVSEYEASEKIVDPRFASLKTEYTLTLVKYWIYTEQLKATCNRTDYVIVLFFYSNVGCDKCEGQGFVLDSVKQLYGRRVMIFALDPDIGLGTVNMLKGMYGVAEVPTLVVNGKTHTGFVGLEDLKNVVCKELGSC